MVKVGFETRDLVFSAILIGIGFVLHAVFPPIFFGIKPDFLLACMFVALLANINLKNALVTGSVAGIVAALTTGFPGGQLPSIFDKLLSALLVFFLLRIFFDRVPALGKKPFFGMICFLGTLFSGIIFLGSALLIAGLPAPFMSLLVGIVLPTALANTIFGLIIYQVYQRFAR